MTPRFSKREDVFESHHDRRCSSRSTENLFSPLQRLPSLSFRIINLNKFTASVTTASNRVKKLSKLSQLLANGSRQNFQNGIQASKTVERSSSARIYVLLFVQFFKLTEHTPLSETFLHYEVSSVLLLFIRDIFLESSFLSWVYLISIASSTGVSL